MHAPRQPHTTRGCPTTVCVLFCFLFLEIICRFLRVFFVPFPLSLCMENRVRRTFPPSGWCFSTCGHVLDFDFSLCENSINQFNQHPPNSRPHTFQCRTACVWPILSAEYRSTVVVNHARGQLKTFKKTFFSLFPFAPENLVSRDWFGRPVPPRQPVYSPLHTQTYLVLTSLYKYHTVVWSEPVFARRFSICTVHKVRSRNKNLLTDNWKV